jgi:hypothetical protein
VRRVADRTDSRRYIAHPEQVPCCSGMSVGQDKLFSMTSCTEHHPNGWQRTNKTENAGGWCGPPRLPGFQRTNPPHALPVEATCHGTARHIRVRIHATGNVMADDGHDAHVTHRVPKHFRFHHGRTELATGVQSHGTLGDFPVESACSVSKTSYWQLASYRIVTNFGAIWAKTNAHQVFHEVVLVSTSHDGCNSAARCGA